MRRIMGMPRDWFKENVHPCAVITSAAFALDQVTRMQQGSTTNSLKRFSKLTREDLRQVNHVRRLFPLLYLWPFTWTSSQSVGVSDVYNYSVAVMTQSPSVENVTELSVLCWKTVGQPHLSSSSPSLIPLLVSSAGRMKYFQKMTLPQFQVARMQICNHRTCSTAESTHSSSSSAASDMCPARKRVTDIVLPHITKVYAMYSMQDRPHVNQPAGQADVEGTDWHSTILSAPTVNRLGLTVLEPSELGYYNQAEYSVRKAQGQLARQYGVDGFIYHHYFFYQEGLGATLAAPLEGLLRDGEPDLPFALHWANQDWSVTGHGKGKTPGEMLQRQNYPNASSGLVEEHYAFLRRLFHHRNYILVHGVPLFLVYQTFEESCWPILSRLRELAMADGFPSPGLHIPQFRINTDSPVTAGVETEDDLVYGPNAPKKRIIPNTKKTLTGFDADVYYPATHNFRANLVPKTCVSGEKRGVEGEGGRPVYLSTLTTFDDTARRDAASTSTVWSREWSGLGVVGSFERDVVETMVYDMCCQSSSARSRGGGFMLVNAWNEWAEGMVLEPSNVYGREFLEALSRAKKIASSINCNWVLFDSYHIDTI